MAGDSNKPAGGRLAQLLQYLAHDENNAPLLVEAAEAALAEQEPQTARDLMHRYAALSPLGDRETNIVGLTALQLQDYEEAAIVFARLMEAHPADPSLRFNRAWSLAMLKRFEDVPPFLDDVTTAALPQAAMLQIQVLHELGQFEEAEECARKHIARHPDHAGLMAAVSVLAIDVEDFALAQACAQKAGDHPDALTTLGVVALGDARDQEAAALFERALAKTPEAPRAWVGMGLSEMTKGAYAKAAETIERGAQLFGTHLGSWIAAGWAFLLANNLHDARRCFQHALDLDRTFAESHGSLAVVAIMEGDIAAAQRFTETAQRLDKVSFSTALASALLLEAEGKPELARRIIERAMHTPMDATGGTIAQAIAKRALLA